MLSLLSESSRSLRVGQTSEPWRLLSTTNMRITPNKPTRFLASLACSLWLFSAALFGQETTPTHSHMSYGPEDRQWLNLFLPDGSEPAPVFIYAHHNGSTANDVKDSWANPTLAAGTAIVSWESIAQIKSPEELFTCVADAEVMFDWIKDHTDTYNLDLNNIIIGGQSRGSFVSWQLAHSQKPGIVGIYMGQALPGRSFNEKALEVISANAPHIFLAYRKEPGAIGDIHDPAHGLKVLDHYKNSALAIEQN